MNLPSNSCISFIAFNKDDLIPLALLAVRLVDGTQTRKSEMTIFPNPNLSRTECTRVDQSSLISIEVPDTNLVQELAATRMKRADSLPDLKV
jgi:hypothetical protein